MSRSLIHTLAVFYVLLNPAHSWVIIAAVVIGMLIHAMSPHFRLILLVLLVKGRASESTYRSLLIREGDSWSAVERD